jgi:hypothetical protein
MVPGRKKQVLIQYFSMIISVIVNIIFCNNLNADTILLSDSTKQKHDITLLGFYHQGWVMPTNVFVKGENMQHEPIKYFRTVSLQLSKQTSGEKLWEQLYNYPRYGAGINVTQFINAQYLETPVSIFSTLGIPLLRWNGFSLYSDLGLGLAFNWGSYNDDRYNIAIGAEMTMHFNEGFSVEYKSENGLIINAGASLTHFSNGSLKVPNRGINTIAPKIGLGYNFTGPEQEFKHQVVPDYRKQSEIGFAFFAALRNEYYYGSDVDTATKDRGVYYTAYGLSASFNRQISYKSKFGIGIMADYWGFANSSITVADGKLIPNAGSFREGLELSIFPAYELILNRLSVVLQNGFYLYRTKYPFRTPATYQRIGLKFSILKDVSFGVNLRIHSYSIADYIEWTFGYRLPLCNRI